MKPLSHQLKDRRNELSAEFVRIGKLLRHLKKAIPEAEAKEAGEMMTRRAAA